MATTEAPHAVSWIDEVERTQGWLSLDEARELHAIASQVRDAAIVEVGAYRGRSTIAIAAAADESAPVFVVEPHERMVDNGQELYGPEDRAAFFESMNRSGAYRNIRLLNISSEIITPGWNKPVGMLWIDGDHTLEGVTRDWDCWKQHLTPDAVVAFDDAHDENVGPYHLLKRLVDEGVLVHRKNVGKVRTLTLG